MMETGSVVRAVFEFLPSVSEELPLFAGDVVEVLSVVDEFWLLGIKDGVTGTVPAASTHHVIHQALGVLTSDLTALLTQSLIQLFEPLFKIMRRIFYLYTVVGYR